jgi:hypothetical protein
MSQDIATLLKEATKGLLSEESLATIKDSFESAVNDRVTIHVEKALTEQDAEYTAKLEHLLEAIDTDHTRKLHRVVEAIDKNNASKLQAVVRKYSAAITEQADSFKDTLVEQISNYLDVYLEKSVPQASINEAVKNKKAHIVLENLRKALAVDVTLMKESVKDAVLDGKAQITEATAEANKLKAEVAALNEKLQRAQADLVFEQKTSTLPETKKAYARRVLQGKSAQFILENIDYTLSLFDKKEEERLDILKEEAFEKRVVREQHVVVEESTEQQPVATHGTVNNYLSELSKY